MSVSKRIAGIRSRLKHAMIADQWAIKRRLRSVSGKSARNMPPSELEKRLKDLERGMDSSIRRREARLQGLPRILYPEHLPIFSKREEIVRAVQDHPVVIISGDTGSGKSTQIPKMCLEAGRGIGGRIGCTQPRRIAATTVAERIAEEMGEKAGGIVGYKVRFTDRTGPGNYIKILTDGMLLAETRQDRFLNEYDTIIIDEAHERSLNIDFLLGVLRILIARRKDLHAVITSATLDTEKFAAAFGDAPVIEVSGRLYPVEVEYAPVNAEREDEGDETYVDLAVQAVERIALRRRRGDVLVFMPTEQDIRETCERLEARGFPDTIVLPLFARLPAGRQRYVFSPLKERKVVVATNVAETSLTIPGIRYVIDTGLARIPRYHPSTRTTSLAVSPVSRSSADQRMGRCGRISNGVCIRLYSQESYESRPEYTLPEILRSNLAEVILRMLAFKLGDIQTFPFVDPPNLRSVKDGFDLLTELGAVTREKGRARLTHVGLRMANLPLDPRISRMMLEALEEGCSGDVAVIAAALGIQDPRERPADKAGDADAMHRPFKDKDSDFLTLLNIWNRYQRTWESLKTQNRMRKFCRDQFLSFVRMREWRDIHQQIATILEEENPGPAAPPAPHTEKPRYEQIHRAILSGFLSNIAVQKEKNIYRATRGRDVMIFPGSTLFNKGASWIVAMEMVLTSRLFARTVARIDPEWLESLGGSLCRSSFHNPHWEKSRGEVRATEQVTLFGLVIVPGRSASFAPVDRQEAHRIFVRSALVQGEVKQRFPFLTHNLELVERFASMEDRIRRRDILVNEEALEAFYSERLPGVCDIRSLKARIKKAGGDDFLKMTEDDLIRYRPEESVLSAYPEGIQAGDQAFPLTYRFSPGSEEDGVTVSVPSTLTSRIPRERLEWLVPGLFEEKITALIKGLPKRYRKQLVPVSDTVEVIAGEMERTDESLLTALGRFIYRRFGVDIPASAWPVKSLPDHLRMRVSITDHQGLELLAGRDPALLSTEGQAGRTMSSDAWERARAQWERNGITRWDFDALPREVQVEANLVAFPALEPEEEGVRIRLFPSAAEAGEVHPKGVARILALRLSRDLKFASRVLRLPEDMSNAAVFFGGARAVDKKLLETLIRLHFRKDVRTAREFEALAKLTSTRLISAANDLLDKVIEVLRGYARLRSTLHHLETPQAANPAVVSVCKSIRTKLAELVPGDFLDHCSTERLIHLPRYLKALELRAERGSFDPSKDRKKAEEVEAFENELRLIRKTLPAHATEDKRAAVEEFAVWIDEYRVSIFAPELSTAVRVSSKRLKKKAEEIHRMI
ncbi:MAG: ATP-dependent RNA helicase HrpA [Thermodesulfobacteriota bacterium]